MNYKICVIGNEALLFPFLQFGFASYTPPSEEALRETVLNVIDNDYGIIYIEDSCCFKIKDILDKYRYSLTPIFIPIGEGKEGGSYYQKMVTEMMDNAVGMRIL